MADRNPTVLKSAWMKQAEEAKLKNEAEKAAAAKAAFEATFKDVSKSHEAVVSSDSEAEEEEERDLANKPIGPVDPVKCTAAGAGIAGGTACSPSTFVVVTKDADGRKVISGGAQIKVKITPGVGVGVTEQDGIVKDMGDGTYSVTYAVPKRGNYMVNVDCNGKPIMGSPFPVFFSSGTGTTTGGLLGLAPSTTYPTMVNQTMPNMPNYMGSVSGSFPGLLGTIPGMVPGASGGVLLPGMGASFGEVCQEYLYGRCAKADCKFNHPPQNLLMTALAATTTMGTLSQVPMAPSAAAMAAARAIVAARALQAHTTQAQAQTQVHSANDSSVVADAEWRADSLKKTLQVSNLSPLLTVDQLKQLFSFCGTVVECIITDSKHFAYIEYSKPEEATAALALNNMDVGGRPLNVEMAKSLPPKQSLISSPSASSSLPVMMQQAVAMQQMQFQQALLMQQAMTAQQAANRAASMKSATELAAARAAEISKKLKSDGPATEETETDKKSRSPTLVHARSRSRSKSKSPISFRRRRRSRSYSPYFRHSRDHRSRSPFKSRHYNNYVLERRSYRDFRDNDRCRRDFGGSRDRRSRRDRSESPQRRKTQRDEFESPKRRRNSPGSPRRRRDSPARKIAKFSCARSRSPENHRGSRSSPRRDDETRSKRRRRSRSRSLEVKRLNDMGDTREEKKRKDRRRSRSGSVDDGKRHKRNTLLLETSDDVKPKRKRHSRSRSLEDRHMSTERADRGREEKSRRLHRRRSKSLSSEGRRHRGSKVSPRHLNENKSKQRRRSRSNSAGSKQHANDDVVDESKYSGDAIVEKRSNGNGKQDKSLDTMGEVDLKLKELASVKGDEMPNLKAGTGRKSSLASEDDIIEFANDNDHEKFLADGGQQLAVPLIED